ncbi:permease [Candidatus Woesearchaeota archaeon]|nr:permease [Candidatus Woesearchaeota archaeon]
MLQELVDYALYGIFGLSPEAKWAMSLNFFLYDSVKIILLLLVMISVLGFFRTYLPQEKVKAWMNKRRYGSGHLAASIFGALTPFCSCSSIPIFLGFMESGIPLGIGLSFLITSPLVNEYLVVLMLGFFGWKITLAYVASGIILGTAAGLLLGRLGLEKELVRDLISSRKTKGKQYKEWKERVRFGLGEALEVLKKLWLWILAGVAVGALIHNFVPEDSIRMIIEAGGVFAVPLAVVVGVPIYANCAAVLPIALVLFQKGVPLGTALAFMMATSALSLPEAVILRRAMKLKLILIFFGTVAAGIVLTGYLFNLLQGLLA